MRVVNDLSRVAVEAAKEAGRYMVSRLGGAIEVSTKGNKNNLVTDVDKKSESMIISRIRKAFPEHSILAEESGNAGAESEYQWIIDPLDGTTNYAHGFPFFCVSIAAARGGVMETGVVYDPTRDELFTARKGEGAYLNGRKINVSGTLTVDGSLIATGFAYHPVERLNNLKYMGKVLEVAQAVRRAGSAALDLCYVAAGRFDGFWEQGLKPWDTAAGHLIVKEAGGIVTTMAGLAFDVYQSDIVASNGKIHPQMLSILNK